MAGRIRSPRLAGWLLIAAATTFATWHARADEVARIGVKRVGKGYEVSACASTTAGAELAWQVLTDFDHLSDFVPDLRSSRVISAPGEPLRVDQQGRWHALFFRHRIEVVFAIELDPPRALTFRAVDGNLRPMWGHLRLTARPDCRIEYRTRSTPDFWIPPLIGPALIRGQVRDQLDGVLGEIRRRQQILATSTRHLPAD
ncbi:MAG: SRPBCC family protein [Gammaproteobacteria bacterium]|nr:SRPBCC family protein [Gammaproteobacteria bacterium]